MTDDPLSEYEAWHKLRHRLIARLAPIGIASAIVSFDGSGDDGQIEDVAVYNAANERMDLPDIMVDLGDPDVTVESVGLPPATQQPVGTLLPLAEALENFAYDTLAALRDGWQDNDGSYGTVTLEIASGKAILDFNARFTDAHNSVIAL
jgi:hypothetical protein